MSEPSKQKSTESSMINPGTIGGLLLLSLPLIPILALVGLAQALDFITEDKEPSKNPGKEETNDKMDQC